MGKGGGKMKRDRKRIRGKENWRGKKRRGEKRRRKEGGEDQQLCSHIEAVLAGKRMQSDHTAFNEPLIPAHLTRNITSRFSNQRWRFFHFFFLRDGYFLLLLALKGHETWSPFSKIGFT